MDDGYSCFVSEEAQSLRESYWLIVHSMRRLERYFLFRSLDSLASILLQLRVGWPI